MSEKDFTIVHYNSSHTTTSKYDIFCNECGRFYINGTFVFIWVFSMTIASYFYIVSLGKLSSFIFILSLFLFYTYSVLRKDYFSSVNFSLIFLPILILLTFQYFELSILSDDIIGFIILGTFSFQLYGIIRYFVWGIKDGLVFFEKKDPSRNASLILIVVLILSLSINLLEIELEFINGLVKNSKLNLILQKVRSTLGFISEYKWKFTYGLFALIIILSIGVGLAREVKSIGLVEKKMRAKLNKNLSSGHEYSFMRIYQIPKFFMFWLTEILGFILSAIIRLISDSLIRIQFILFRIVLYFFIAATSYFMFHIILDFSQTVTDISSWNYFWTSFDMLKRLFSEFLLLFILTSLIMLLSILNLKNISNEHILKLDSQIFARLLKFFKHIGSQIIDRSKGLILNLLKFTILLQLSVLTGWMLINLSSLFLNTKSQIGMIFISTITVFLLIGLFGLIFGKRYSRKNSE